MEIISMVAATCLALNVYMEARSEPLDGQMAVAQVTVRRANSSGNGVCDAVIKRKQFSWTAGADGNGAGAWDVDAWRRALNIAHRAILWGKILHFEDRSAGATHFAVLDVDPYWAEGMVVTAEIGNHRFYRAPRSNRPLIEAIRRYRND